MLAKGMYVVDRYEILEKIGAGGMSDVYKAKDHILDREVAVKVLKAEFAEDVTFVTKFRSEAQSAARLEHPNIVNIYDVGSENGMYYIVMEYVEGITLKTYVEKKGRLNFKEAISIAIQVGRGIEAAHNKNIIHRDIKPQNIIISTEGKVKVTDFGIARAATSNTIHADVMGSVHYASPEQARNGYVDARSDIYSLGIVMYEMVTGRVPFDGDSTVAVAIQHLQEEMVAPSAYAADLPISLEKIILKATMKNPDRRYSNMEDLLMDLKKALVSPNEDFVTILDADEAEKTRVVSAEEQEQLRKELMSEDDDEENSADEADDEEEEGPVNPKLEKAITIMGIAAAVIIIALAIYLVGSFMGWFRFGSSSKEEEKQEEQQVEMISLLGMTEEEAKEALEENDLKLGIKVAGYESSDEYEEGQIMKQSVKKGEKVKENTKIEVTISSGVGDIDIPNVVGKNEDAAIKELQDAGFSYAREYQYSDQPQGQVISQSPTGQGKEGDKITIVVSQGVQSVKVPSVLNQTQDAAVSALTANGLNVGSITTAHSDTVPRGCVISQDPGSGKTVDAGTTVNLVISSGPEVIKYRLDNFYVQPRETATYYELKDGNGKVLSSGDIGENEILVPSISEIETSSGKLYYYTDSTKKEQIGQYSTVPFDRMN